MTEHFDLPNQIKATIEVPQDSKGSLLWLLGRGAARLESLEDRNRQAQLFRRNMLTFDYTGQGETGGKFGKTTISRHVQEAESAYDWLEQKYPNDKLTITGASYGGFVAALLAQDTAADNLILRAPALFPLDLLDTPWAELEPLIPKLSSDYRQNTDLMTQNPIFTKLARFTGRILIIQHEADETIPPAVLEAYRMALPEADFWLAPDVPHAVTAASQKARDDYERYLADWLNS